MIEILKNNFCMKLSNIFTRKDDEKLKNSEITEWSKEKCKNWCDQNLKRHFVPYIELYASHSDTRFRFETWAYTMDRPKEIPVEFCEKYWDFYIEKATKERKMKENIFKFSESIIDEDKINKEIEAKWFDDGEDFLKCLG